MSSFWIHFFRGYFSPAWLVSLWVANDSIYSRRFLVIFFLPSSPSDSPPFFVSRFFLPRLLN